MFKVDFMSSLKDGQVNGFDLAVMEELEQKESEDCLDEEYYDEYEDEEDYLDDFDSYEEPFDSDFYDE